MTSDIEIAKPGSMEANLAELKVLLAETKKKNKLAWWAMVIQFVAYVCLTAASFSVIYHLMYLMNDTTVDASTGNLLVKSNNDVEVSVKSHGKTFTFDSVATDSTTGQEIGCVNALTAVEMFQNVVDGSMVRFLFGNESSGEIDVIPLGTSGAYWNSSGINFGNGMVLVPMEECSSGDDDDRRSLLASYSLEERHLALRQLYLSSSSSTAESEEGGNAILGRGRRQLFYDDIELGDVGDVDLHHSDFFFDYLPVEIFGDNHGSLLTQSLPYFGAFQDYSRAGR